MKSQYQNYQKHLNGNYSNQDATMMQTQAVPLTEEVLNQDNRICYKKRREELNQRVKSVLEKKKQVPETKTTNSETKKLIKDTDESSRYYYFPKRIVRI